MQVFAICIDDSLPKFTPDAWIEKDRWYKVKHFAHSLNTDGLAVTITNNKGEEINPSNSMSSFIEKRFIFEEICLN